MKQEFPFKENIHNGYNYRKFSKDVNDNELTWHRDKEDRIVIPLHETDWKIQFDNEIPKYLNEIIAIPKNTFHRVIKGSEDLNIKIKKLDKNLSKEKLKEEIHKTIQENKEIIKEISKK